MAIVTNSPNPFAEWLERYAPDPVLFAEEVFGFTLQDWQKEALQAYGRGQRHISIRSGHGVGKTTTLAIATWHHGLTRYPQKTVMTAPTSAQLFDALWAEVKSLYAKLPIALQELFIVKADRIELASDPAGSFIAARTARAETPEALQGIHSDNVLLIGDEASAIPEPIFEAAVGSMSGPTAVTFLAGNPTRTSGTFFETHHKLKDRWFTMKVSCEDSTLVSKDFIEDMVHRYGGRDSNQFRIRVLGEFPLADADAVIPYEMVDTAQDREIKVAFDTPVIWGLDLARSGNDRSALAKRQGAKLLERVNFWSEPDLMVTVGRVKREYDNTPASMKPIAIMVDAIGIGAGVADRLRELGLPSRAVNVSESAALNERYANLRAELWFRAREWFESRTVTMPKDDRQQNLVEELTGPSYKFTTSGKYQVEGKADMKRRGVRSPDLADAFCLTFAHNAGVALFGNKATNSWSKPITRGGVGYA